ELQTSSRIGLFGEGKKCCSLLPLRAAFSASPDWPAQNRHETCAFTAWHSHCLQCAVNVSLYQAAAAMNANARWQEAISENLASSSIPGFKKQNLSFDA